MSTSPNNGLWTMTKGQFEESVRKLEAAIVKRDGNPRQFFDRIRTDECFTGRIAEFMLGDESKRARAIMGKNFFGVEKAIKHFGIKPNRKRLSTLAEIPFSEAVLKELKDTHILVAVFPHSINEMRRHACNGGLFSDIFGREKEFFAKDRGEISWQLVRKTPVDNSTMKNWPEQQALLGTEDTVPTAQVMVYAIISYFIATGERLFEQTYIRTSSTTAGCSQVNVGCFNSRGLTVDCSWNGHCNEILGVASARKPSCSPR